jgi:hypothetical protein
MEMNGPREFDHPAASAHLPGCRTDPANAEALVDEVA